MKVQTLEENRRQKASDSLSRTPEKEPKTSQATSTDHEATLGPSRNLNSSSLHINPMARTNISKSFQAGDTNNQQHMSYSRRQTPPSSRFDDSEQEGRCQVRCLSVLLHFVNFPDLYSSSSTRPLPIHVSSIHVITSKKHIEPTCTYIPVLSIERDGMILF